MTLFSSHPGDEGLPGPARAGDGRNNDHHLNGRV